MFLGLFPAGPCLTVTGERGSVELRDESHFMQEPDGSMPFGAGDFIEMAGTQRLRSVRLRLPLINRSLAWVPFNQLEFRRFRFRPPFSHDSAPFRFSIPPPCQNSRDLLLNWQRSISASPCRDFIPPPPQFWCARSCETMSCCLFQQPPSQIID